MSDLNFFVKITWETFDFKNLGKTGQKGGCEIHRDSGPTPVARGSCGAKAHALAARPSLRGQGWELALACILIQIHLETGPRRFAEANTGTREQGRELALAYMW